MNFRIFTRFIVIVFFLIPFGKCFAADDRLSVADSLFEKQKFTEAKEVYESYFQKQLATPAMLLKMAYIEDATGSYEQALFYLHLYYKKSGDRLAVGKIEELAKANDLSGYSYNDFDYFEAIYANYKIQILFSFFAIVLLLFAYLLKKLRNGEKPVAAFMIQLVFMVFLLILVNFKTTQRAIIVKDYSLLKSGPSAGAPSLELVSKGHQVTVLEQAEVWSKIRWVGKEVYIRSSRIKLI